MTRLSQSAAGFLSRFAWLIGQFNLTRAQLKTLKDVGLTEEKGKGKGIKCLQKQKVLNE